MDKVLSSKNLRINSKVVFWSLCYLLPVNASAITLDSFAYNGLSSVKPNFNQTLSVIQSGSGAIGGTRSVEATSLVQNGSFEVSFSPAGLNNSPLPGNLSINSSFYGIGNATLTYDGDDKVGLTNYTGLNSLDLTEGGANAIGLDLIYDYPFGSKSMDLVFTFYDASDITGNKWSRGTLTLDRQYRDNASVIAGNPTIYSVSLLYSSFNKFGSNGGADLTNIGAFTLGLIGNQASDLLIANLHTNGSPVSTVPEPISLILFGSGVVGLATKRSRARSK